MDDTKKKIIDATMKLVVEKGYTLTTTKDIAKRAGVNECTIFRRFKEKKEIVLAAMQLKEWNPSLAESDFEVTGDVRADLIQFATAYMAKVTPQMVKLSIGLRTPELLEDTTSEILKIPMLFKKVLIRYFDGKTFGKEQAVDSESLAIQFLSMVVGFVFLKASFAENITKMEEEQFITDSVDTFLHGIR